MFFLFILLLHCVPARNELKLLFDVFKLFSGKSNCKKPLLQYFYIFCLSLEFCVKSKHKPSNSKIIEARILALKNDSTELAVFSIKD